MHDAAIYHQENLPNCVPFLAGQFGLPQDCVAQCELIASMEVICFDAAGPLGTLDDTSMRAVIKAIGHVWMPIVSPSN